METSTTGTHPETRDVEGRITRAIERRTSRVPSGGYLALAIGSMALAAGLMAKKETDLANFVGQWAPALLIIGLYNKVVKLERELAPEEP